MKNEAIIVFPADLAGGLQVINYDILSRRQRIGCNQAHCWHHVQVTSRARDLGAVALYLSPPAAHVSSVLDAVTSSTHNLLRIRDVY